MFITQALVYIGSSSVNHSCYFGTAGVRMFHFHKKSLRFSKNFKFSSTACATFLKVERLLKMKSCSRKRSVLHNLGKVNCFAEGGSLEIGGSFCGKSSLAGAGPWIPKAFGEARTIRVKGIPGCWWLG